MDMALMLTGLAMGGFLVMPVLIRCLKGGAPALIGLVMILVLVTVISPQENPLQQAGGWLLSASDSFQDGMADMGAEYRSAFRP